MVNGISLYLLYVICMFGDEVHQSRLCLHPRIVRIYPLLYLEAGFLLAEVTRIPVLTTSLTLAREVERLLQIFSPVRCLRLRPVDGVHVRQLRSDLHDPPGGEDQPPVPRGPDEVGVAAVVAGGGHHGVDRGTDGGLLVLRVGVVQRVRVDVNDGDQDRYTVLFSI